MSPLNVIVGCESSGVVREAFARRGHFATSCDVKPAESEPSERASHHQGDLLELLSMSAGKFDLLIAHPPCTYLCGSGIHWNHRRPGRSDKTRDALQFVRSLFELARPIEMLAVENPVGLISTMIRPASQYIQPYDFGEDASKKTGLWLRGLPRLTPTKFIPPRMVDGLPRWSNQTDSGQNKLGPSEKRTAERSRTYPGIAEAMADQWTGLDDTFRLIG